MFPACDKRNKKTEYFMYRTVPGDPQAVG